MSSYAAGIAEGLRIVDRLLARAKDEGVTGAHLDALRVVRAELRAAPAPEARRRSDIGAEARAVGLQNLP